MQAWLNAARQISFEFATARGGVVWSTQVKQRTVFSVLGCPLKSLPKSPQRAGADGDPAGWRLWRHEHVMGSRRCFWLRGWIRPQGPSLPAVDRLRLLQSLGLALLIDARGFMPLSACRPDFVC